MLNTDNQMRLEILHDLLFLVADRLNSLNIVWYLGGSSSLMIQGVSIIPNDIDIVTTPENEDKIRELLQSIDKKGIRIEVNVFPELDQLQTVVINGVNIPVIPLKKELYYYRQRPGKENIVNLIEERLSSLEN